VLDKRDKRAQARNSWQLCGSGLEGNTSEGPDLNHSEAETLELGVRKVSLILGSQVAVGQQSIKTIDNADAGCDGKRGFWTGGWHEDSSGATDSVEACSGVVAAAAERTIVYVTR
jgi:hypothetical protein